MSAVRLPRRESIRVGPYRVRLVGGDLGERVHTDRVAGAAHGLAPPPLPDASPPSLALELNHRGIRPAVCPIRGDLTLIGSSADCDVRVLDPSVSNYHCSLLQTAGGVWVVDLLGCGGVTVNGALVRARPPRRRRCMRIGHSLIRLRAEPTHRVTACAFIMPTPLMADPEPSLALEPLGTAIDSAVLPTLDKGELIEAILTPLSEQFDLMRQQMFEQLQQVGVVLFERFTAIQEEQIRAARRAGAVPPRDPRTGRPAGRPGGAVRAAQQRGSVSDPARPGDARSRPPGHESAAPSSSPGPRPTATGMPTATAMECPGPNPTRLRKRR